MENIHVAWLLSGLAVVGAYILVVMPILYFNHLLNKMHPPVPEKELDELLCEINGAPVPASIARWKSHRKGFDRYTDGKGWS